MEKCVNKNLQLLNLILLFVYLYLKIAIAKKLYPPFFYIYFLSQSNIFSSLCKFVMDFGLFHIDIN